MNNSFQSIEDYYPGTESNLAEIQSSQASSGTLPAHDPTHDPVSVVQELCECNQSLLTRIDNLEGSLARCQQELLSSQQPNAPEGLLEVGDDTRASLAIAHDVATQQEHLITILAQQLEANLKRVADFEREAALNQHRYREQSSRVVQLEQDVKTLQSRLQRQQYYSLQLKAALEKTVRHNEIDPIWLERVWSQLAKEGGFAASSAAITSWSQNSPDSLFPTPVELESWLDNLTPEKSPWTASEVLFAEPESEPTDEIAAEPAPAKTSETLSATDLAAQEASALPLTPKPQRDLELPLAAKPSCSFNLVDMPSDVNTTTPKAKPSAPDLPSFLKSRSR
jgi:hypothetical protein